MERVKSNYYLSLKAATWFKDSHSLFDYESNKISTMVFNFSLNTKSVILYRKRQSCTVEARDSSQESKFDPEEYQFLTRFEVKVSPKSKIILNFFNGSQPKLKKLNSDRMNTDESISSYSHKEEETYIIVRKLKDINGEPKGYRLEPGQTIKLGRVEYFVSEVSINDNVSIASYKGKGKMYANRKIMKYAPIPVSENETEKQQCKICLDENETEDNFFFKPCKCDGFCGTVHFDCLLQWIHVKVRKEVNGGTLHYNFDKFECEVCKHELPMVIDDANGKHREMLPIEKPKGNYLILEGACEKTKSMMVIQNVPTEGIKLGRGHECQIRITDISVSRNHALIKNQNNGFFIFDNKSKFGTLVKEEKMNIELGRGSQGIQIGRTVVTFDVKKEKDLALEAKKEKDLAVQVKSFDLKKDRVEKENK